jgi:hypothetical protein
MWGLAVSERAKKFKQSRAALVYAILRTPCKKLQLPDGTQIRLTNCCLQKTKELFYDA